MKSQDDCLSSYFRAMLLFVFSKKLQGGKTYSRTVQMKTIPPCKISISYSHTERKGACNQGSVNWQIKVILSIDMQHIYNSLMNKSL